MDTIGELLGRVERKLYRLLMYPNMETDRKQVDLEMTDDKRLHELEMDATGEIHKDQIDSDTVVERKLQKLEMDAAAEDAGK